MADTTNVFDMKSKVCRIRFHKDAYVVAECSTKENVPEDALIGYDMTERHFIAVGYGIPTECGSQVFLSGVWDVNKKYGSTQFMVQDCTDCVEKSKDAIVAYLSSKIIKGIGPSTAEKIYNYFGEKTLDVLAENPRRLLEVKGISAKRLNDITRSYTKHQEMHILTRMLAPHDVSYRMIVRIRETLGENAATMIRENPYHLCRVWGIGFQKADEVARSMGIRYNSAFRIEGGVIYTLRNAMETDGHMFLTRGNLITACTGKKGILNPVGCVEEVESGDVNYVISDMLADKKLIAAPENEYQPEVMQPIYLPQAFKHEQVAAEAICELLRDAETTASDEMHEKWSKLLTAVEEKAGVHLAPEQREGVIMAMMYRFSIITGGPGSGKTTSLAMITSLYQLVYPEAKIALAAPTGRAARRMEQQTGMTSMTIHKLLNLTPNTKTNFLNIPSDLDFVDADFLIIDESSMIDAELFAELMLHIDHNTKVLMLGDVDQLPSVGAGNVLRELLSLRNVVPFVKLTKIFRQSDESIIPQNAAKIRKGDVGLRYVQGQFSRQACADEAAGAARIVSLVKRLIELGRLKDMQILCPMKRRGACCTKNLNDTLHDIVNPPSAPKIQGMVGDTLYRVGDKVMQTKNISEVSNGDIGYIQSIVLASDGKTIAAMTVAFESTPEPIEYDYDEAFDLEPATAMTIHKSQGSEFPIVIVPVFGSMAFFLRRNLFYTAITRASEHVVVVTDDDRSQSTRNGVVAAIRTEDTSKRNTLLGRMISNTMTEAQYA